MYWRRIRRLRLRPVCTVLINCRTTTSMYTALRNNWGSRLAQTRRCRLRLTICRRRRPRWPIRVSFLRSQPRRPEWRCSAGRKSAARTLDATPVWPDGLSKGARRLPSHCLDVSLNVYCPMHTTALAVDAGDLRAVIGGFGERHVEEYRIGFTRRGNAEVLHGIVWPLYGEEEASFDLSYTNMEDGPERHSNVNIIDLLKETGIHELRRHPHRFEPEYCDDCGAPLYADPLGEIVHAGMPEEVETAQPRFH